MSLHLIKLCVGAESIDDLIGWSRQRLLDMERRGEEVSLFHTTRMVPKRIDELLDGGSLYWVIKGSVQARQVLTDIRPFTDAQGIRRCRLMLGPRIIATEGQPRRAFQGWRYLKSEDAPVDLPSGASRLPPELHLELARLGLL